MNKFITLLLVLNFVFVSCSARVPLVERTALSITGFPPKTSGEKTVVSVSGKNFETAPKHMSGKVGKLFAASNDC